MSILQDIIENYKRAAGALRANLTKVTRQDYTTYNLFRCADSVNNLYSYQNPWTEVTSNITDALGTCTPETIPEGTAYKMSSGAYFRLSDKTTRNSTNVLRKLYIPHKHLYHANNLVVTAELSHYYDLASLVSEDVYIQLGTYYTFPMYDSDIGYTYTGTGKSSFPTHTRRLLLPPNCYCDNYMLNTSKRLTDGLYLNKLGGCSSNWIRNAVNIVEIPVKNPPNSNVPYYLNKILISAEDMVAIFENMIDRSAQTTTKYITLGSTNLAKLTEEQKQIAYAKGWQLK